VNNHREIKTELPDKLSFLSQNIAYDSCIIVGQPACWRVSNLKMRR